MARKYTTMKDYHSVIWNERCCFFCKTTRNLECHHIFNGAYKRASDDRGFLLCLCNEHHTGSNESVHKSKAMMDVPRVLAQEYYEKHYGNRDEFRKEFGKSYL